MFNLFHSKTRAKEHADHKSRRKAEDNAERERGYQQARQAEKDAIEKAKADAPAAAARADETIVAVTEDNIPVTVVTDEDGRSWYASYRNNMGS